MQRTPIPEIYINGERLRLPAFPEHHHSGPCACEDALAYIRVSDLADREEIESPVIQLDSIVQSARDNNRRIIDVVYDLDESGQTFDNRQVGAIVQRIARGEFRHVMLWKWSRWGREMGLTLHWIRRVEEAGGEIDSATEPFDTTTSTGVAGRNMVLLFADWQGRVIGETWKSAHKTRRDKGLPHTGIARFGYSRLEKPFPRLEDGREIAYVPKDGESLPLAAAYQQYVDGVSLRQIAKEWNAAGLRTTNGRAWTPQSLGKMLDTGFAAGKIRERSKPTKKPVNRIVNYDVWRDGSHAPLITEELWAAYKVKREAVSVLPPRSRVAAHGLSALLFCGACGRRLSTKYAGRNRTHQWVCQSSVLHPGVNVQIANAFAVERVASWLDEMAEGGSNVEAEARRIAEKQRASVDLDRFRADLAKVEGRLERLLDLHLDGGIEREAYDKRKAKLDDEAKRIRIELADAEARRRDTGANLDLAFRALNEHWGSYLPADQREALSSVVAGIVVQPGRTSAQERMEFWPKWEAGAFSSWLEAARAAASA